MKKLIWVTWIILTASLVAYFGFRLFASDDKSDFIIGEASHGHFQIEMTCGTCHTSAFGGQDVLQDACTNCHAEELEEAHDSHPKKKFTDPREAYRIEILDARYCVSCHTEHQKEQTRSMGVTLPDDYCFHCHEEVGEERESHADLPFDSCASAGCHNFHDNRALYESFLTKNAGQAWVKEIARLSKTNATDSQKEKPISLNNSLYQDKIAKHPDISEHWQASSHADAGVDCGGCHQQGEDKSWIEKPSITECETCHKNESQTFTQGKHGMRLAPILAKKLSPITTGESAMDFHPDSINKTHGCNTCHNAHEFNPQAAAVDSCINCHADEHTLAYENSKHATLWKLEINNEAPLGSGVSCASCHMPRIKTKSGNKTIVSVQHNQNWNLRPNEKMIRSVCMECHSLEFSIDALADKELIRNNFTGKPGIHIESIDWALKRAKEN
ncbi:MAG: cytochrome c3 family protein [Agarilytica sp.]